LTVKVIDLIVRVANWFQIERRFLMIKTVRVYVKYTVSALSAAVFSGGSG
jgi:hypothetical protein